MWSDKPEYVVRATAIVGCGISLFFCVLSLLAFSCFRRKTESMVVKKHLTFAVAATQILFLVAIEGYKTKIGCRVMSVLLHFTASASFTWCAIDALALYFFHANSFHPIRNTKYYLYVGWGIPAVVIILTLIVGFTGETSQNMLSLYTCWPSDHILWAFVAPSILVVAVDIAILCTILKQLRYPSYDISPKAVIEKRGTRYGLRTNSLMLLGLCIGWIFAFLSFKDANNLRYQLTFGLVNGLQGILLFFFHCLLSSDHVKGYISASDRTMDEIGCGTSDSIRSRKQETQSSAKRKSGSRTSSKLENVPLISVNTTAKQGEEVVTASNVTTDEITLKDEVASEPVAGVSGYQQDCDVIPQLPGTPDTQTHTTEFSGNKDTVTTLSIHVDAEKRSRAKRPKTEDNQLQVDESSNELDKRRKSSSEPVISSCYENSKGKERIHRKGPGELYGYSPHKNSSRSSRTHTSSVNELESLFAKPEFSKPQRSSLSSFPQGTRPNTFLREEKQRKKSLPIDARDADQPSKAHEEELESRTPSRNTEKSLL